MCANVLKKLEGNPPPKQKKLIDSILQTWIIFGQRFVKRLSVEQQRRDKRQQEKMFVKLIRLPEKNESIIKCDPIKNGEN